MNEPHTVSSNASNVVLPQPALTSSITEDDDEPPIGGNTRHDQPQSQSEVDVKSSTKGFPSNSYDVDEGSATSKSAVVQSTTGDSPCSLMRRIIARRQDSFVPSDSHSIKANPNRFLALFTPVRPAGPAPTYKQSLKAALRYTPLNFFLLFIPTSWALHYTHQSPTLVFIFSALGIIPLAALLGFGTEQIALRTSSSVGGLLNATLGNIVEMIIAGIALKQCELDLVQSSLLGGLLSNLLLVLGMAFLVGGYRFHQQEFQPMVAQLNSSLMTVAVISLIIPAAFHEYLGDRLPQGEEALALLELSRGSAIILIVIYFAYLVFQFYSHNHLFLDTVQTSRPSSSSVRSSFNRCSRDVDDVETLPSPVTSASPTSPTCEDHTKLNIPTALFLLVASTALAYITAENLVSSLEGLVESHPEVSKEWLTLIVIPIISNAAEHTTAVVMASKGKFDLAMSVAVGSCIQIALFVVPVLVLVAWGMRKPLTLLFDELETVVLFFSVLVVKFSIEDGKSHWMSGVVLVAVYVLIALSFWNFPESTRTLQGQTLVCVV